MPGQLHISPLTNVSTIFTHLIAVVAEICAAVTLTPFESGALPLLYGLMQSGYVTKLSS
jgi:hypothetical protein